jgi:hypothetical protein
MCERARFFSGVLQCLRSLWPFKTLRGKFQTGALWIEALHNCQQNYFTFRSLYKCESIVCRPGEPCGRCGRSSRDLSKDILVIAHWGAAVHSNVPLSPVRRDGKNIVPERQHFYRDFFFLFRPQVNQ